MDYRNADGSIAEMCGNGIRVFVRYLAEAGLAGDKPVRVGTRAGVKEVVLNDDGTLTVDMGEPVLPGPAGIVVEANGHQWPAVHVDMGNPHAVAFVDDLREPGRPLSTSPPGRPAEALPARRERGVRRPPGSERGRDAGARARLGGDAVLRDRDVCRGRGGRAGRPAGAPGHVPGRRTGRCGHASRGVRTTIWS